MTRSEGDPREGLSGPPTAPIFVAGALAVAAHAMAFFSVEVAIWTLVVAGLAAAVAAYLMIIAVQAALQSVRTAVYFEEAA